MTPSRLTTAAAAVVFAAGVAGCGSVSSAGAGQPAPQKLRLATSAAPSPGPSGNATGPPGMALPVTPGVPGWAQVELTGALPTTGPGKGAVRSLSGGQAPAATVRALAAALHLSGSPRRVTGGWRSTGPGTLQVFDGPGLRWTYLGGPIVHWCYYGPPIRISGVNPPGGMGALAAARPARLIAACPMKPGQLEPAEPVPVPSGWRTPPTRMSAPSGTAAVSAAKAVLRAAGVAGAPLRITTIGSDEFVSADPTVDGLATSGLPTTVGVGPGNRIGQASGWLGQPVPGASYPLISARQAFNRLKSAARPRAGGHPPEVMCPLNPDVFCGTPGPIRVMRITGAVYGLALSYNRGEPVLVPSWLFSVAGSSLRLPEVAINPRYLNG